MPDDKGKLTQPEIQKAIEWLQAHGATKPCPACGNEKWNIAEQLGLTSLYSGGAFVIGAGYPVLILFCTRCSYMRHHSAMAVGLVPPSREEPKAAPPARREKNGG